MPPEIKDEVSQAARENSQQADQSLAEMFDALGGNTPMQIKIIREEPRIWKGMTIAGHLDTLTEPITEDEIKARWGGGKYLVKAMKRGALNKLVYAGSKTVPISGPPKISEDGSPEGGETGTNGHVVFEQPRIQERALEMANETAKAARERFEKLEDAARTGANPMIDALVRQNAELQKQLFELATKKDDGTPLIERVITQGSTNLDAVRERHASELRELRKSHEDELVRQRSRFEDALKERDRRHERDLDYARQSADRQVEVVKEAAKTQAMSMQGQMEARVDGLKGRIDDLNRALGTAEKELTELRLKKDVPVEEQMQKIFAMRDMFKEMMGDDTPEETMFEKVAGKILENPLTQAVADRIANGPSPAPQQPAPPQKPQRRPAQPATPQQRAARQQARQQQPGQAQPPLPPKAPPTPEQQVAAIPGEKIAIAVAFLTKAFNESRDPEEVAQSARSLVPPEVLGFLRQHGVDGLLEGVAQSDASSPLATQGGKSFVRKVAKFLLT